MKPGHPAVLRELECGNTVLSNRRDPIIRYVKLNRRKLEKGSGAGERAHVQSAHMHVDKVFGSMNGEIP